MTDDWVSVVSAVGGIVGTSTAIPAIISWRLRREPERRELAVVEGGLEVTEFEKVTNEWAEIAEARRTEVADVRARMDSLDKRLDAFESKNRRLLAALHRVRDLFVRVLERLGEHLLPHEQHIFDGTDPDHI